MARDGEGGIKPASLHQQGSGGGNSAELPCVKVHPLKPFLPCFKLANSFLYLEDNSVS